MGLLSRSILLALVLPASAYGQQVKQADLMGKWVSVLDGKEWEDSLKGKTVVRYLTFETESTYRTAQLMEGKPWGSFGLGGGVKPDPSDSTRLIGTWTMVGDSIRIGTADQKLQAVELKDGRFFLWTTLRWKDRQGEHRKECADVFRRLEPSKPLPAAEPLQVCK